MEGHCAPGEPSCYSRAWDVLTELRSPPVLRAASYDRSAISSDPCAATGVGSNLQGPVLPQDQAPQGKAPLPCRRGGPWAMGGGSRGLEPPLQGIEVNGHHVGPAATTLNPLTMWASCYSRAGHQLISSISGFPQPDHRGSNVYIHIYIYIFTACVSFESLLRVATPRHF